MGTATASKGTASSKATKAASDSGIGVTELAAKLGTDGRTLRKFLRSQDLGVGFGSRYRWPSLTDPALKKLIKAWEQQGQQAE
jgi:hypothetical protein